VEDALLKLQEEEGMNDPLDTNVMKKVIGL
jgi:hypothetical protein